MSALTHPLRLLLTCSLAAVGIFGIAERAAGAVFLYAGTDVPKTIAENEAATSAVTIPSGRTPTADVEVVSLGLTAMPDSADQSVALTNPEGLTRFLVLSGCSSYPGGTSFSLDQQAATSPFGGAGTCPAGNGTYRPSNSPATTAPLTDLLGTSSGTWTLTYADGGAGGSGGTLGSWGLRVTHAPVKLTAKPAGKRQRVKRRARIKVKCNADCVLRFNGDAKKLALQLSQNVPRELAIPIKGNALNRVADGGRLKIQVTATERLGDVDEEEVEIEVLAPPPRPPQGLG